MLEEDGEEAGREEERAESERLAGGFAGMAAQRFEDGHGCSSTPAERLGRFSRTAGSTRSTVISRSNSATLHACAGHPPGRYGSSASNTSDTWPRHASDERCASSGSSNRRQAATFDGLRPKAARYPRTYGPMSQGQTVPW